jgi:hypothetical protein
VVDPFSGKRLVNRNQPPEEFLVPDPRRYW